MKEVKKYMAFITYGPDHYITPKNPPKPKRKLTVFEEADLQMKELHKNDPKPLREPKKIPMPFIAGCPGAEPVVFVTEDWFVKHEKKRLAHLAENKRDMQIDMMELLCQKDRIKRKLGSLNTYKKKDSKKIVKLNTKLRDIDAELEALEQYSGVNVRALEEGSRFDRFIGRVKKKIIKVFKGIKKFVKHNKELFSGIAAIGIPAVAGLIIRKFTRSAVEE